MIPPFDIFKVVDGHLLWVEAVPTLDRAKGRVQELMPVRPAQYVIYSQRTGNKISLKPGESAWSDAVREETGGD